MGDWCVWLSQLMCHAVFLWWCEQLACTTKAHESQDNSSERSTLIQRGVGVMTHTVPLAERLG